MTAAYYNEHDPFAAEWLRRLILFGHIAPGDVDERDIRDVSPDDLRGYEQHHFFAGIGVWSYALRRAGWTDDRPVASASCPCQPFSPAGAGGGFADERHLWPAFYHITRERRFPVVVGEQVADGRGLLWIDLVQADMEAAGYTGGATITPAACYGAPIQRHRTYFAWMARPAGERHEGAAERTEPNGRERSVVVGQAGTLACSEGIGSRTGLRDIGATEGRERRDIDRDGSAVRGLARTAGERRSGRQGAAGRGEHDGAAPERREGDDGPIGIDETGVERDRPGPVNGFWRDADWLGCTDGKWRPVEPGTFPLADGAPARVGRLRGYGNALNAAAAQGFIEAVMECMPS